MRVEVLVPKGVVEWFVTARDVEGVEVWSDWVDYTGYEPSPSMPVLVERMCKDLEAFLGDLVAATDLRVVPRRRPWSVGRMVAEWCIGGQWKPVLPVTSDPSTDVRA
jgi:hypothetical protein